MWKMHGSTEIFTVWGIINVYDARSQICYSTYSDTILERLERKQSVYLP